MSQKEKKKPVANPVIEKAEGNGVSMTYHMVLTWIEIFLVMRNVLNIVTTFMNPYSWQRTVDQIFYVLMLVCVIVALFRHDHKKGVIALFLFMGLELALTCTVYFVAVAHSLAIESLHEKMISMIIGSLVWFVPTLLYYRKRWGYLL